MPASAAEREAFAAEITRLFAASGLTQEALGAADGVGVSKVMIGEYLAGRKVPGNRERVAALDAALDGDGALLRALGYEDRRPTLEERVSRIEEILGIDAFGATREQFAVAADKGRSAGKGGRRTRPSPEPEPEGP